MHMLRHYLQISIDVIWKLSMHKRLTPQTTKRVSKMFYPKLSNTIPFWETCFVCVLQISRFELNFQDSRI